jgi:putative phosphoribosyl transferase
LVFQDRIDAGRQLAETLKSYRPNEMIILALPRGGVPVGYEIAQALHIPLEVLIIRKLGVPGHEELAMGALGPNGLTVFNEDVLRMHQLSPAAINRVVARETDELNRRSRFFRGNRPFPDLAGKTVVIVDDGLATGATAMAAIQAVKALRPAGTMLAVPVCATDAADRLRRMVDTFICLHCPDDFNAVGQWYQDFSQTTDAEVIDLLRRLWQAEAAF